MADEVTPVDPIVYEIPECRYLRFDKDGMTGSRKFRIEGWSTIEASEYYTLGLPTMGSSWSINLPALVVINITCQEMPRNYAEVNVEYSSDGIYQTDALVAEFSTDLTSINIGPGWVWQDTLVPLSQDSDYVIPSGKFTLRGKLSVNSVQSLTAYKTTVVTTMNKVNSQTFYGFLPGHLLFLGANMSETYDTLGNPTSVDITYNFEYKGIEHNLQFRQPNPFTDPKGSNYTYHSDETKVIEYNQAIDDGDTATAQGLYYDASFYIPHNSNKKAWIGTKVYAGGTFTANNSTKILSYPNYNNSPMGSWAYPIINETSGGQTVTKYLHDSVDFATVLGIADPTVQITPQGGQNNG